MGVRLDKDSYAWFADLVQFSDGSEAFGPLNFPVLEERHDDGVHSVVSNDTIEGLALRYYGTVDLWPVIAVANSLEMPSVQLYPGLVLRIPDAAYVAKVWKSAGR
jgi:nucleoid-associated protein YgaU